MGPIPCIGREFQLAQIAKAFEAGTRLITLCGTGGIGKTRLAQQHCDDVEATGRRVCFADVSESVDLDDLVRGVSAVVSLPVAPRCSSEDACDALGRALFDGGVDLLVLDNCEQMVVAVTQAIGIVFRNHRTIRIIATSRERLRCVHEVVVDVPPLQLPSEQFGVSEAASVQLFVHQAKRVQSGFEVSSENEQVVAEIVAALDGVPLALELAAANLNSFGLRGLVDILAQQLDVLRGPRDSVQRQSTLRSTIAWSWGLLSSAERRVLAESSRFRGGFSLQAALQVLSVNGDTLSTLDAIQSLRDKSMLRAEQEGDGIRFTHYRSVALFAREQAAMQDGTSEPYERFFVDLAGRRVGEIEQSGSPDGLMELSRERRNLEAVFQLRVSGTVPTDVATIALALDSVLSAEGPLAQHVQMLNTALECCDGQFEHEQIATGVLSRLYRARGNAHRIQGGLAEAYADLLRALEWPTGYAAEIWADLGVLHHQRRDLAKADRCYAKALAAQEPDTPVRTIARVLGNRAATAHDHGSFLDAEEGYREALALLSKIGDRRLEGIMLSNLALVELELGQVENARIHVKRATETLEQLGEQRLLGITLGTLGALEHAGGHCEDSCLSYERAISVMTRLGEHRSRALSLGRLGAVLADMQQDELAREYIDESERLLERLGDKTAREAMGLARCFLDVAEATRAKIDNRPADALRHTVLVQTELARSRGGTEPLVGRSDDARALIRLLDASLEQLESGCLPAGANRKLVVGPQALWFRAPGHAWQDVRRRGPIRQILLALVGAHHHSLGEGVPLASLRAVGWPAEKITENAGANRVYVALTSLRKLGLEGILTSGDDGYMLDASVEVHRSVLDWRIFS